MIARIALVVILGPALALAQACSRTQAEPMSAAPPPTVSVVSVTPESVSVSSEWIATLDGYVNAQIRPQVSGYLIKTHYREGARGCTRARCS